MDLGKSQGFDRGQPLNMVNQSPVDKDLLELFKICVELADRTSARRAGANTFFVSLNSIAAAVVGYLSATKTGGNGVDHFSLTMLALVGIILSITWWGILRYYRRLSKAKWDVINQMEKQLPVQPFKDEWMILHPEEPVRGRFKWLRRSRHREATVVEQVVPLTFAAVYLVLAIRIACS
jgi:hypothetical protein